MKFLILSSILFSSLSVHAHIPGTPDEDPIVANLRQRFEQGVEPSSELLLTTEFKCMEMVARRKNFSKIDYVSLLKFENFDGFIIAKQNNTSMNSILYTFNGRELIGVSATGKNYDAYRVDQKGYLISEYTGTDKSAELKPISAGLGLVHSYTLCVPTNQL